MNKQANARTLFHCTHKAWIRKPRAEADLWGRFTFETDDPGAWRERCERTGVRIDKEITLPKIQR